MKKLDLLKQVCQSETIYNHDWVISAFSVSRAPKVQTPYPFYIYSDDTGYYVYNTSGEYEKIDDSKVDEPLFDMYTGFEVDPSWAINIKSKMVITASALVANMYLFVHPFGSKIPCPGTDFNPGKFEDMLAPKLKSLPEGNQDRDPNAIYVDEYIEFADALQSLKCFAMIFSICVTEKNLVSPTGIDKFKSDLDKEYEGRLDDPLTLIEYEKKLKDFDKAFLSDDKSYGTFTSGKILESRKKLFLAVGADQLRFREDRPNTVVLNSLRQGWSEDPEQFAAMVNSARIGSLARGGETVKGGMTAKIVTRAINTEKIVDGDCKSTMGMIRFFGDSNLDKLVGSYVMNGAKTELVTEENSGAYLNKVLSVRSPSYCWSPAGTRCRVCAGEKLFRYKDAMTIPGMEVSAITLAASMAAMHGKPFLTTKIDLERQFS